jgi:hypothetical protein
MVERAWKGNKAFFPTLKIWDRFHFVREFACDARCYAQLQHLLTIVRGWESVRRWCEVQPQRKGFPCRDNSKSRKDPILCCRVWGLSFFYLIVSIKDEVEETERRTRKPVVTFSLMEPSLSCPLVRPIWMLHACGNWVQKTCWCLCAAQKAADGERRLRIFGLILCEIG